jgi:hypothetical protein
MVVWAVGKGSGGVALLLPLLLSMLLTPLLWLLPLLQPPTQLDALCLSAAGHELGARIVAAGV